VFFGILTEITAFSQSRVFDIFKKVFISTLFSLIQNYFSVALLFLNVHLLQKNIILLYILNNKISTPCYFITNRIFCQCAY